MSPTPRWMRWLLYAYPRAFRDAHERDLIELYRDSELAWPVAAWDLLKNALAVRWDERRAGRKRTRLRRARVRSPIEALRHDLRFAIRSYLRAPGFTVLALLTLGLGIGATTAVFTLVRGVALRPLPYPSPDRIVRVWWRPDSFNQRIVGLFREEAVSFETLTGFSGWAFTLTGDGNPEELAGAQVMADYFRVLRVEPALGRSFRDRDFLPGSSAVAVISHDVWQRRFGGDPDVVGRTIELEGAGRSEYTVVGVMPTTHVSLDPAAPWHVWVPLERASEPDDDSWFLSVIARLSSDAEVERANADVKRLARRVQREWYPQTSEAEIAAARVVPLADVIVGPKLRAQLYLLLAAVAILLLAASANVASLLLARSGERAREVAVRTALGADRARVIRQLLTESLLLGLLGGAIGAGLAFAAVSLSRYLPAELPRGAQLTPDVSVLIVSFIVALGTSLGFGLAPAVRASGLAGSAIRGTSPRPSGTGGRALVNKVLIATEVAISVVLVVAAGLLIESWWKLSRVDPGFDVDRVLVVGIHAPPSRYPEPSHTRQLYGELIDRLRALPGVEAAGSIHLLPMGRGNWNFPFVPEGRVLGPGESPPEANFRVIAPDYFRAMGVPILSGRTISEHDRHDAAAVGWINEAMAERAWPGADAVGKQIHIFGPEGPSFTVAGVVGNVRQHGLDADARPEMYRPLEQWTLGRNLITLRTAAAPESLAAPVRSTLASIDPDLPIVLFRPMAAVVSDSIAATRFITALISAFAVTTLFLAAVGVYGVTAYLVSRKTREIGLRVALGAGAARVRWESLAEMMRPIGVGLGAGLAGAFAASRLIQSLLFEVPAGAPRTFAAVAGLLAAVALGACYLPARRASAVDPMVALRGE